MKIKVKDGKGKRVCTEIKRPDPEAVLVIEEDKEYTVTNEELNTLVVAGYFDLKDVVIDSKHAKSVYPDSVVYEEEAKPAAAAPKPATPATPSQIPVKKG